MHKLIYIYINTRTIYIYIYIYIYSVMWSTTERREIRNFYYSSVFELVGHQRMTVKRGIGI